MYKMDSAYLLKLDCCTSLTRYWIKKVDWSLLWKIAIWERSFIKSTKKSEIWSPYTLIYNQEPLFKRLTPPPPCWTFLIALIPSPLGIDVSGFCSKTLTMRSVYYNSRKYNNTERNGNRRYSERLSQKSVVPPMCSV